MKMMKLWRIAFMMLAAFSLASCSSDDDVIPTRIEGCRPIPTAY